MPSIEITVNHKVGLHARPAAEFVKTANNFLCDITVTNLTSGSDTINAKSILGILSIGVNQGHIVKIEANGDMAVEALVALQALIEANFGE